MCVWSVQVCLSLQWSCGFSVWATNDCLCHLCFRCSQFISAGVFVCIKASYSRFVCKLAGIFVCFAEGMDEKTAIFQARQRWHTWPVKHALHLTVQLLPRLWRVGSRACRQRDAQPVKERGDSSNGTQRHAAIIQRLLISAWIHQLHTHTRCTQNMKSVVDEGQRIVPRIESLVVLHRTTATQYSG